MQSVLPAPSGLLPAPAPAPLPTTERLANEQPTSLVPDQLVPGQLATPTRSAELPAALLRLADADADALGDRLHDGVLQALVVARYATDAVARGADPGVARDAVQEALVALRRTVWQLRPRAAAGLSTALAELSAQQVAAGAPAIETDLDERLAADLDATAREAAYRLVQAVCRQADQPVGVRLSTLAGRAVLDVSGPLPDPAGWSLRARALGGQLVVGTGRCRLLLPLRDLALPQTDPAAVRPAPDLPARDREAAP